MEVMFTLVFGIVVISTFYWFYLCHRMQTYLRERFPSVYEAMGKPSLFMNNSIGNGRKFNRFLFKREWSELDDSEVVAHGKFMSVYFVFHLILLIVLIAVGSLG